MNNATPASADGLSISISSGDDHAALQVRAALRREMRQRRRHLGSADQQRAATAVARLLGSSALFRRSRDIAFYLANDGEVSLLPLLQRTARMRKRCYLPVIMPDRHLRFALYRPGDELVPNVFGILEPRRGGDVRLIDARLLDLVLMPLVAFDDAGNRLGMGGGFYDRTLRYLRHRRHWRKPRLLGIAHEFQRVASIATKEWDVPLDGVATDRRLHIALR